MTAISSVDLIIGVVVLAVAVVAVYVFWRTSNTGAKKKEEEAPKPEEEKAKDDALRVELQMTERKVKVPSIDKKITGADVERAKSQIRTLTLKQEINSMVLRRLFEAEDEGEISREERVRLGKVYEDEMNQIAEDLKKSEMLVSLAELESIREEIVKKFEESMSQTQSRIDLIIKELKIEEPKPVEEEKPKTAVPAKKAKRVVPKTKPESEEEAEEPSEETPEAENGEKQPAGKGDVESRLEQLKKEVMKELDELDKLELEN
jgi:flagellar basal body-associated protein FliL